MEEEDGPRPLSDATSSYTLWPFKAIKIQLESEKKAVRMMVDMKSEPCSRGSGEEVISTFGCSAV